MDNTRHVEKKKAVDGKCWMMNVSLIKTTHISEPFFIISNKTSCFYGNRDVEIEIVKVVVLSFIQVKPSQTNLAVTDELNKGLVT